METRVREVELAVAAGASEIDIVINRTLVLEGRWQQLYDEVFWPIILLFLDK